MKSRMLICLLAAAFCAQLSMAQTHQHDEAAPGEKLGAVSFAISCADKVQPQFARGMALLYPFEYEQADQQFQAVSNADPSCAMALWGRAMTLYHQLWSIPTPEQRNQGWRLIQQAQQLKAPTQRERDYVDALAVFYSQGPRADAQLRAEGYSAAMEKVYTTYPQDHEAAVLYALSLLASARDNDLSLTNERKAVGILGGLFSQQPDHPGIAHYIIHACDNPKMARLGLAAARKYASIAPSSPHATHMPSHIFARLGLWQDDINSNLAALDAAGKMAAMHMHVAHHELHSIDFLEYAYLQSGDDAAAKAMAERVRSYHRNDLEPDLRDFYDYAVTHFPSMYAIERRDWNGALALTAAGDLQPSARSIIDWAHAIAAGHLKNVNAARAAVEHFNAMIELARKSPKPYVTRGMETNRDEATAWLDYAQDKPEDGLKLLRQVAARQDAVGKGEVELPAREMVADMLLELNRPDQALAEYEKSLQSDPNRFNGLYGAARAAELAHYPEKARTYYAQLVRNCESAKSNRDELQAARHYLSLSTDAVSQK